MALIALIQRANLRSRGAQITLVLLGVFGASLFYGDGMITPAISVLSAVEGLEVVDAGPRGRSCPDHAGRAHACCSPSSASAPARSAASSARSWSSGSACSRCSGLRAAPLEHPEILGALSPHHGAEFLFNHGHEAFVALGGVVLAVTGAEALYADMGHFGAGAIRRLVRARLPGADPQLPRPGRADPGRPGGRLEPVLPALPGLGADPDGDPLDGRGDHRLPGRDLRRVLSVTRQAVRLGFLPRLVDPPHVDQEVGQIYVPAVNWIIFAAVRRARASASAPRSSSATPTGSRSPARCDRHAAVLHSSCARSGASRCGS